MGLDIEQSTSARPHGFPLAHDPITSIAIVTWDKRYFCRYTCGFHRSATLPAPGGYDVLRLPDSESVAKWAIDWLVSEIPDFVAIHNGYSYDVKVLCVHCPASYSRYFRSGNLGKQDGSYDFDIPGVTMIDTYRYPDKLHRGEFSSFSLLLVQRYHVRVALPFAFTDQYETLGDNNQEVVRSPLIAD